MGDVNLAAAAHRIIRTACPIDSAGTTGSADAWDALGGLNTLIGLAKDGLAGLSGAEADGLVEPGTYDVVSAEVVAATSGSRSGLAAAVREMDRILSAAAARRIERGKRGRPAG